jgi:hypothetical protein
MRREQSMFAEFATPRALGWFGWLSPLLFRRLAVNRALDILPPHPSRPAPVKREFCAREPAELDGARHPGGIA